MIIWWLFDDYFTYLPGSEPLTHFRQAMLPQNTGGQACTRRKGGLGFVVFITARWPLCFFMPAVTIIRMQGCELAITVFAFETQESLDLLALRLTLLTAHWRPQHWQFILLSKMARTPRQIVIVCFTSNNSRIHNCMAELEFGASQWATGENTYYKSLHRERERWFDSSWQDCATTCLIRKSIRKQNSNLISQRIEFTETWMCWMFCD